MEKLDSVKNLDACIKCSACTSQCPVATVQPLFSGPKSVGPDAERFRLEGIDIDPQCLSYCSNCKTCEVTCPSGVKITEIILRAREKASLAGQKSGTTRLQVRDLVLGRAEYLGRLGTIWPGLTNGLLKVSGVRVLMEQTLGISRRAPLPPYQAKFKGIRNNKLVPNHRLSKAVVFFPGCFINYNDSLTGQAVIKVLEHNGYDVIIPNFHCCGVPLQANGKFNEARGNAKKNLALMNPYLQSGVPVITGCTSCGLALKEEYPNLEVSGSELIGRQAYDLFEFLWLLHEEGGLKQDFQEIPVSLGYHAPCHLKAQGIGTPVVRLLRLIPGVRVLDLDTGCCGLSGSYGYKQEKYDIARQIGEPLFRRVQVGVRIGEFQSMATECGGCQVQIEHGSGIATKHPIWVFMQAYGLD
ncbi:anaerobic glycerol-3-phosphate dehydrogenase subunit C [Desulfosporosinus meridiei]|uniref:Glycerol 3-phosphate dehydrogenase (Quinone) subunit C n=1 Tax=Desulfosporosinus meridiei (strain ATCC BAA-275 / DSM 13257 / KCTC 12902 / NCIMB 13706 / S10) TaxID=768704 RepID=J7IWY0_DESMD|nr:anaerobic glycerol-3-phosphate dehydrogenase subunit C [Desulfosporosinus meridiei]AFQ46307.1 glycerol 3-phosphate dehydrogenase (quinone) subunit C [Desulfosporosinus meridiei DSM 13257]